MSTSTVVFDDAQLKSLALAVARNRVGPNDPIEEVLARETVAETEFDRILTDPLFKTHVTEYVKELTETGFSFAYKSKILAEELLPDLYHMARDPDLPAAARVKIAENLVEWAGLKPRANVGEAQASGPGFHITFNIPTLPQEKAAITMDAAIEPTTFSIGFTPVPTEGEMMHTIDECAVIDAEAEAYDEA